MCRILYILILSISIAALQGPRSFAQTPASTSPAQYTIHGDNLVIESSGSGSTHVRADGNVHLTYTLGPDSWQLSADTVEYVESTVSGEIVEQTAVAEGDVSVAGPGITAQTPGSFQLDLLARRLVSEGDTVHVTLPNGEITTGYVEMVETFANGYSFINVQTARRTSLSYDLTKETLPSMSQASGSQSIFGSLDFSFGHISLETDSTHLLIRDGEPIKLDSLSATTIESDTNTLTSPAFFMSFDPPTLTCSDGVEIRIGEDVVVRTLNFNAVYPPEGGLTVDLEGKSVAPAGMTEAMIIPIFEPPDQVTIIHPAGTFYADKITFKISPEGSRRIDANGHTKLEMPMGELMQTSQSQTH
jgi:hypothetical protein